MLSQIESQLGGDYSEFKKLTFGSRSTHTLLSYFDIDIHIITLLEGERKVDRPIYKSEHYKELKRDSVLNALNVIKKMLQ